ncbi:DUF6175 family protein [Flavobacterium sp. 5]|uniref:DUF6175 family protein n=1 Tax=Flavobacterium sp. 5 TaxID=2035199 RepID=UPI000C2CCED4|nr:DUF6175 family protein [Flavobacterium sp. 5]PKB15484.1 hypothetical protein CLU82_0561 [Flavobacterium sp. 5]
MKKIKFTLTIFALLNCIIFSAFSQNAATNSGGQVTQIQPSIIVIPYKTIGQNYRQLLEDPIQGFQKRIAISRVKEAFDSRGFTTYDFEGELKKSEAAGAFSGDAQTDEKDVIVKNSGADIFVVVDIDVQKGQSGTEVKIILQAFESATGRSLSNKDASSGKYYTDDVSKLAGKAVDVMKEDFLNVLQTKFTDIVNNGRSLYLEFVLDQNATMNFQTEVGSDGDLLSESIVDWMGKNAYKNYAKKGGSTALKMIYDDVRIPLKDQATGMNYEVESFGRLIRKYLKTINVISKVEYPRGQIIVTIQ